MAGGIGGEFLAGGRRGGTGGEAARFILGFNQFGPKSYPDQKQHAPLPQPPHFTHSTSIPTPPLHTCVTSATNGPIFPLDAPLALLYSVSHLVPAGSRGRRGCSLGYINDLSTSPPGRWPFGPGDSLLVYSVSRRRPSAPLYDMAREADIYLLIARGG